MRLKCRECRPNMVLLEDLANLPPRLAEGIGYDSNPG
jgi:hypothetical protein